MNIALLSDTHGHRARTQTMSRLLRSHRPGLVIHCGDLGSEGVLFDLVEAFSPDAIPVYAVIGNVDLWDEAILAFPRDGGVAVAEHHDLERDGLRLGVAHGHDARLLESMIAGQKFDFIFTGHTHVRDDTTRGRTRVINPGAVYRSPGPGAAMLDTGTGALDFIDLPRH